MSSLVAALFTLCPLGFWPGDTLENHLANSAYRRWVRQYFSDFTPKVADEMIRLNRRYQKEKR